MTRTPANIINAILANLLMCEQASAISARRAPNEREFIAADSRRQAFREAIALIRTEAQSILSPKDQP